MIIILYYTHTKRIKFKLLISIILVYNIIIVLAFRNFYCQWKVYCFCYVGFYPRKQFLFVALRNTSNPTINCQTSDWHPIFSYRIFKNPKRIQFD